MSLRLAPYNDAMRLGQGFNSYTHELCIDGAVHVRQRPVHKHVKGKPVSPSQVVSYSARCVEKLSDIVEAMNLSYSSSIKKGTIEISGNSTTVDENTFKLSDLNVVVSVRVVNQTISVEDEATFVPLKNEEATAARFSEIYGDSYISGFIEGGDFSGIVSVKVIDRSNVSNVVNSIKASLMSKGNNNKATGGDEFTFGPSVPTGDYMNSTELSAALKDTQTIISINWMGGGQIKEPTQSWDIDSMYAAAAAFPASVAQCPQRTWAILTPYKANRSFVNWSMQSPVKTLQYDLIASFTAELFDRFMDYKLLLKRAQHILSNRRSYRQRIGVVNAIGTEVATLLALRAALRNEQTKIVEAIEVLGKDPTVLKRQAAWTNGHKSEVVRRIVETALGESKDWQPVVTGASSPEELAAEVEQLVNKTRVDGADHVTQRNTPSVPAAPKDASKTNTSPQPPEPSKSSTKLAQAIADVEQLIAEVTEAAEFNFDTLIAPEVWEELLPEPIEPITVPLAVTAPVTNVGPLMGPGIGGLTSFTLTAPPPDDKTGPASMVITSQSYADMEKELKTSKESQAQAQKKLATLQTNFATLQAKQSALEQTARQASERATSFEQQAKSAESARAQAVSDLQAAQRTISDVNAELLSHKNNSASRIATLERDLAAATKRVATLDNDYLREKNSREDYQNKYNKVQGKIDAFKKWCDIRIEVHHILSSEIRATFYNMTNRGYIEHYLDQKRYIASNNGSDEKGEFNKLFA